MSLPSARYHRPGACPPTSKDHRELRLRLYLYQIKRLRRRVRRIFILHSLHRIKRKSHCSSRHNNCRSMLPARKTHRRSRLNRYNRPKSLWSRSRQDLYQSRHMKHHRILRRLPPATALRRSSQPPHQRPSGKSTIQTPSPGRTLGRKTTVRAKFHIRTLQ